MPGNEEIETPSLLERLRARREWSPPVIESRTEYVTVATYGPPLVNPDGPEAATTIDRQQAEIGRLRQTGRALVAAVDQMIEDTTPMFAEMQLVRGRGPYSGKQIGEELEAFRKALEDHSNAG